MQIRNTASEFVFNLKQQIEGTTCFIIGGGPSFKQYLKDLPIFNNKNVIVINNAYKLFPNALLAHFADDKWYIDNPNFIKDFKNSKTTCGTKALYKDITTFYKEGSKTIGIATDKGTLAGNNGGHHAINIAYHLGFKTIVLLGFDMNPLDKQQQWHNEHKRTTIAANYRHTMLPGMERIAKEQTKLGIKIINVNPNSNIKCFQFDDLKNYL